MSLDMFNIFKHRESKVFFIRGYAKSGTHWICNLMNLHPHVSCRGEFQLERLFEAFEATKAYEFSLLCSDKRYRGVFTNRYHEFIKQLIIDVCRSAPLCGDRTPCPLRSTVIPGVKTLYISRDGRDAMVSWVYHAMNEDIVDFPQAPRHKELHRSDANYFEEHRHELLACETTVRAFGRQWNDVVRDDFDTMNAADEGALPLEYHWIRYEDLHLDAETERRKAYQFLGLDPDLARPISQLEKPGFGSTETNRPDSFFRRGQAGTWREYFTEEQLSWFESEARDALILVGSQPET